MQSGGPKKRGRPKTRCGECTACLDIKGKRACLKKNPGGRRGGPQTAAARIQSDFNDSAVCGEAKEDTTWVGPHAAAMNSRGAETSGRCVCGRGTRCVCVLVQNSTSGDADKGAGCRGKSLPPPSRQHDESWGGGGCEGLEDGPVVAGYSGRWFSIKTEDGIPYTGRIGRFWHERWECFVVGHDACAWVDQDTIEGGEEVSTVTPSLQQHDTKVLESLLERLEAAAESLHSTDVEKAAVVVASGVESSSRYVEDDV